MRILLVNKFYDLRGGTERVLFDLEEALREDGHETAVFATREDRNRESPWREYFAEGRDYENPSPLDRLGHAFATIYDWQARKSFSRILDDFRPEVVHLHNIYHQLSPSILDELRSRGIPAVMTLHDYKLVCPAYRLFRGNEVCEECVGRRLPWGVFWHSCSRGSRSEGLVLAIESTWHRWRRSYERSISVFISPSHFLAAVVRRQGLGEREVRVIPNAPRFDIDVAPTSEWSEGPTVLVAGRLSEEKGLRVILEASRDTPGVEIRIAGDGPLAAELRATYSELEQLRWLGSLDAAELGRERARAWAIAVPSVWYENAPLTAIEAFHSGRAVIAADHGGLVEMVEEGVNGWRVAPGDPTAWAETLKRVEGGKAELMRMGEAAAALARERYRFDSFYESHLELYREVSGERIS